MCAMWNGKGCHTGSRECTKLHKTHEILTCSVNGTDMDTKGCTWAPSSTHFESCKKLSAYRSMTRRCFCQHYEDTHVFVCFRMHRWAKSLSADKSKTQTLNPKPYRLIFCCSQAKIMVVARARAMGPKVATHMLIFHGFIHKIKFSGRWVLPFDFKFHPLGPTAE